MSEGGEPVNVAGHLALAAARTPYQPAILPAEDGAFPARSFAELNADVSACSNLLRKRGVRPGDKTLLMVRPGYELILCAFALFHLGAPPVVIDPGMGLKNFLRCVRRTRPDALVGIPLARLLSLLFFRAFRSLRTKVTVRAGLFLNAMDAHRSGGSSSAAEAKPDDLAAILFTSGSTGTPKGVRYEHGTFAAQVKALQTNFGFEEGETDLATLPVFALFNPALGLTTVVPDMDPRCPAQADAGKLADALLRHRVTSAFGSPVLWRKLADHCEARQLTLPDVKRVFLAGAATPPDLVERLVPLLPNARILFPYGATEALPVSVCDAQEVLAQRPSTERGEGSCLGVPLPGISLHLLPVRNAPIPDLGEVELLPPGEVGEITVGGPVVTKEYHLMPGATFDAKVRCGEETLHRMGDLGYLDKEGRLRFLGRKAERVLTPDGPLETERAEPVANALSKVKRSALIGLGAEREKEPALVVEPEPECFPRNLAEEQSLAQEVLATLHIHERLRPIRRVFFEQAFPVDARHNAKIHRLALARKWTKKAGPSESNPLEPDT